MVMTVRFTAGTVARVASYVWGPDIGSTGYAGADWQKAGGVGGLLMVLDGVYTATYAHTTGDPTDDDYFPLYDRLGNIIGYRKAAVSTATVDYNNLGATGALYDYDAFGRELRSSGPAADLVPFHFSTKFTDQETGLNYYGYRYYDPQNGRWLGRDLIGENGGLNLFQFCLNDSNGFFDFMGEDPYSSSVGSYVPAAIGEETDHFKSVSDTSSDEGHSRQADSGKMMIEQLKTETKNSCCLKTWTIAGHGWRSDLDSDGKTRMRGRGIPGSQRGPNGAGLYNDDTYPGLNKDNGGASLDDLQREIQSGTIFFCPKCTIQIHSCYVGDTFIARLAGITGCSVIAAGGKCSGGDRKKPWKSGPTDHPQDDKPTDENGFRKADPSKQIKPIGPIYTPVRP